MITSHITVGHTLCLHKPFISFTEFLDLPFLISERLYHTDPGKAVFDLTVDLAHTHTVFFKRTFHVFVVNQCINQHHNYNSKTQKRHLRLHIHQDDQRSEQLDHRDQNILRSMMKKFCDVKEVACDPGKQLSHFLVVIKCKRKFLVMTENLISHVVFNVSPHHVAIISDKITASQLHQDQCKHTDPNLQNDHLGFLCRHFPYGTHDITYQKGNDQSNSCSQKGKKQIREKQTFVWFIIVRQQS